MGKMSSTVALELLSSQYMFDSQVVSAQQRLATYSG